MKQLLFFITCFLSLASFAQIEMASPANILMESDNGKQIRGVNKNVNVYYNTTTDELRIRFDLNEIVTGDSAVDASLATIYPYVMIFIGTVLDTERFFAANNVSGQKLKGTWWIGNSSITTEADYMAQTFVEQDQSRRKTRLQFNNQLDISSLKMPILSALANYSFNISLPDSYVNFVTQY